MSDIHSSAIIDPHASIGRNVKIGPFCVIGPDVSLGDACVLESHVVVTGQTMIGPRCHIFPYASIGHMPQDLKFDGEDTRLEIGSDNRIREHVTMNPGTSGGGGVTRIGNHGLFMVGVHIAHDCMVGDHVVMANNATLAGHVEVGDHAIFGGMSAIHQFCRVGEYGFLGGGSIVVGDIIPFGSVTGNRASLAGLNLVGLKRGGFERAHINDLRAAYKMIFGQTQGGNDALALRLNQARADYPDSPLVMRLLDFMEAGVGRGYSMPPDSKE